MLYHLYELGQAAISPARAAAYSTRFFMRNPFNPLSYTNLGRNAAAAAELLERTTRRYSKPSFNIKQTVVKGEQASVTEETVWRKPFCNLIRFRKNFADAGAHVEPKLLIVAPLSGHHATLLRGTVEAMLPYADVYITDWQDARFVPSRDGSFDLDDYIDYVIEMLELFGGDVHVMAVCQPAVPVISAIALMETCESPAVPRSLILKGGPIDTRVSQTAVNKLAEERGIHWFRRNVITSVPWPSPGYGRQVYPGFLQLTGFMAMNLDRHVKAHKDLFFHLVRGDGDSVDKHKEFYDEYLAVMDLAAEYYIQTIEQVFIKHQLPKGEMLHRGQLIDLTAIRRTALMTVEGEKDDITGRGQTEAAIHLCTNLPSTKKLHYTQEGVGHYGIFNGSRYRSEIVPLVVEFMASHDVRGNKLHWFMHRLAGEQDVVPTAPAALKGLPAKINTAPLPAEESSQLGSLPAKPVLRKRKARSPGRPLANHSRMPGPKHRGR